MPNGTAFMLRFVSDLFQLRYSHCQQNKLEIFVKVPSSLSLQITLTFCLSVSHSFSRSAIDVLSFSKKKNKNFIHKIDYVNFQIYF